MHYRLCYKMFDGYRTNSEGMSESRYNDVNYIVTADTDEYAAYLAGSHLDKDFSKMVSFKRIDQEEKTTDLTSLLKNK